MVVRRADDVCGTGSGSENARGSSLVRSNQERLQLADDAGVGRAEALEGRSGGRGHATLARCHGRGAGRPPAGEHAEQRGTRSTACSPTRGNGSSSSANRTPAARGSRAATHRSTVVAASPAIIATAGGAVGNSAGWRSSLQNSSGYATFEARRR